MLRIGREEIKDSPWNFIIVYPTCCDTPRAVVYHLNGSCNRFCLNRFVDFLNIYTGKTLMGREISQEVEFKIVSALNDVVVVGVDGKYQYIGEDICLV